MIRLALLSVLLICGGSVLTAQKKGSSPLAKVGLEDPFTGKDAKAMAALGVKGYGPLVWAENKRTTDVEKVLGEGRVLWMETEHFKLGCNLGFVGAPKDSKARRSLKAEMKRLNKKCRKIPASKSKMGPWLRMHIYAQRCEDMLAEFAELSGKQDQAGLLGQKEKFLILLFQKRSDLARYLQIYGRKGQMSQRLQHYASNQYSLVMAAEGDDGPRDAETVNAQFRFFLTQMFCDAAGGAPFWLSYGLAHWNERQIPCRTINCGVKANESVDPATQYQWEKKVRKRSKHDGLCMPFDKLCRETDLGYYGHLQCWSYVDYMLQDREKFTSFLAGVLGNTSRSRQMSALQTVYEIEPAEFDAAWRKWVQKAYK